jgi:hypothetical protein
MNSEREEAVEYYGETIFVSFFKTRVHETAVVIKLCIKA